VGYSVALAGGRETLEHMAAQAGPDGERALVVPPDVSDEASVHALFDKTKETFGRLDLLFNNAGTNVGHDRAGPGSARWACGT
jgi:NAD(P)-dependent dehydrogenase (short-subunit alcohol dehydrogenase family)